MKNLWERRLRIVDELHYNRAVTYKALADQLGVSKDTIRTDISALGMIIPIITSSGNGGGVFVPNSWKRGNRYLTPDQEELLIELMMTLTPEKQEIMQSIITTFAMPRYDDK